LKGAARDQFGKPLTEYFLYLDRKTGNTQSWSDWSQDGLTMPVVHPEGRFSVEGLPPGVYTSSIRHFDYPSHEWKNNVVITIPTTENAEVNHDIAVEAKERLYGRVVDRRGVPIHPCYWTAWFFRDRSGKDPQGGESFSLGVEPDGRFRVCLSKEERRRLIENSNGLIELSVSDADKRHEVATIHIDKLSRAKDRPTVVIGLRPAVERRSATTDKISNAPSGNALPDGALPDGWNREIPVPAGKDVHGVPRRDAAKLRLWVEDGWLIARQ